MSTPITRRPWWRTLPLLLALGGAYGALALGGWPVLPVEVVLRPVARPAPLPSSPTPPGLRLVQLQVTQPYEGIRGLAVGDRVQFDRYGVLAPQPDATVCVWLPAWAADPVLTPLGGAVTYVGAVVHRAGALPAECPPVGRLEPLVSRHP